MSSIAFSEEGLVLIATRGAATIHKASELADRTTFAFAHGHSYRWHFIERLAEDSVSPERLLNLGPGHDIVACVATGSGIAVVRPRVLANAAAVRS
jgi:hypothetical protein